MKKMVLGGSASCFDLFNLEKQFVAIKKAPIDFIHYDVVDGHFNQCIILGLPELEAMRPHTELPIEVHLAVYDPERYIEQFVKAGADIITIHPEGTEKVMEAFELIRKCGAVPALALRSETEMTEALLPAAEQAEYIIKLTVNPGFSGQKIQFSALDRMKRMREALDKHGIKTPIAADGNVNVNTVPELVRHGASMLIGGTSGLFLKNADLSVSAHALIRAMQLEAK